MYNLAEFSLHDMTVCSSKLRTLGTGAAGLSDVSNRLVNHLYDHFLDGDTGQQACALIRLFTTQAYGDLSTDRQACAQRLLGAKPAAPDMKCLTLCATAGERPEWNHTDRSQRHKAIPLVGDEFVAQFPMISQLLIQLGVPLGALLRLGPELLVESDEHSFNVFYVPDAIGSPFVPVQHEFVIPYGVRSVLGFGGLLPSGNLFVVVLFAKVFLSRTTADLFKPLALSAKLALLPFDVPSIAQEPSAEAAQTPVRLERHDSQIAALEQLLSVQEEAVVTYAADRKYAEEALQDSEAALSAFMHGTKDVVLFVDRLGIIRSWNDAAQAQFGYSAREVHGQPVDMILTAGFRAAFEHAVQVAATMVPSQASGTTFTSVGRRKNGTTFPLELSLMAWKSRTSLTLLATIRDISERTRIEAALAKSESHLRNLVEHVPEAIFTLSPDGAIISLNPMFETMTHWPRAEWVGKPFTTLLHPDDVTTGGEIISYIVQKRCPITCMLRIRSRDRSDLIGEFVGTPLIEEGQVIGLLGIVRDITGRKMIEQALRQSEEQLRSVVQSTQDAIVSLNAEGLVIFWNHGAEQMFGYAVEEMLNQPLTRVIPERFREAHRQGIMRAAAAGQVSGTMYELTGLRKEGSEFPLEFTLATWKTESGLFFTGVMRDISERKRTEDGLHALVRGTASVTGEEFFSVFVRQLAAALNVAYASVTEVVSGSRTKLRVLACWERTGQAATLELEYESDHTPCATVLREGMAYYARDVQRVFPEDQRLIDLKMSGYLAIAMTDSFGKILGHVCIMDTDPLQNEQHAKRIIAIFAARAAAELERLHATAALRQSEARQALILNSLPIAFYTVNASGASSTTWVSDNLEQVTGFAPRTFIERPQFWATRLHPEDRERVLAAVTRGRDSGAVSTEYRWQTADGSYRWYLDHAVCIRDGHGNPKEFIGAWIDITPRKRAEEALRESQERLSLCIQGSEAGIWDWDVRRELVYFSPRLKQMLGHDDSEMENRCEEWESRIHPDDRERALNTLLAYVNGHRSHFQLEHRLRHKDGSYRWILSHAVCLRNEQGKPYRITGSNLDISGLKQIEHNLQAALARLRTLSGRLEVIREEERGRIARELHDEFGVGLTCLKIDLSRLTALIGTTVGLEKGRQIDEKIRTMTEFIDTTIVGVQRIVSELRPAILDDLGLVAAIEWQSHDFQRRTGIACTLHTSEDDLAIEPARATTVFRICQEALTNVARHAGATAVSIRLEEHQGMLTLEVKDNGRGIAEEKILYPHSLGLLGMRERAELCGGSVTIVGRPNAGTTVTLHV
ncbi:MAG TPA: PAS domain S-box protein [Nitrospiraceae bacterium]|nr:PAS domain S-box protein [Nitrospiraceae bacterium]